jgi:FAD dependent oxidoreductase
VARPRVACDDAQIPRTLEGNRKAAGRNETADLRHTAHMKISHQPTWVGARQKAYPQLRDDVTADLAIIGGGLTGLLTAYLLSTNGKKVVVLEAGRLGSGATAYTTGFITQVIDTSLSDLIRMVGPQKTKSIWQAGEQAINRIERIVKKEKIDCEFQRCSARIYASSEKDYAKLVREHRAARCLGFATRLVKKNILPFEQYGFHATLGLVLLSCVPWHLRFTAQPFLVVHLAQLLDFVAQFLDPFANFFRPWSPVSHCHGQLIFTEIIDDFWAILQNQSTKLQRSHRRPRPTTDEGLPQRS